MQRSHMAKVTFRLIEFLFSFLYLRIIHIPAGRHTQAVHIQVHILHVLGRHVQLVVRKSHHTALIHLYLSLTYLLRITAVGHPHVTGES